MIDQTEEVFRWKMMYLKMFLRLSGVRLLMTLFRTEVLTSGCRLVMVHQFRHICLVWYQRILVRIIVTLCGSVILARFKSMIIYIVTSVSFGQECRERTRMLIYFFAFGRKEWVLWKRSRSLKQLVSLAGCCMVAGLYGHSFLSLCPATAGLHYEEVIPRQKG